jgi:hypothetical protein
MIISIFSPKRETKDSFPKLKRKQTTQNKIATPTLSPFSSLPLPMHVESDCPLSMWTLNNHFACCPVFFFHSLPQQKQKLRRKKNKAL